MHKVCIWKRTSLRTLFEKVGSDVWYYDNYIATEHAGETRKEQWSHTQTKSHIMGL